LITLSHPFVPIGGKIEHPLFQQATGVRHFPAPSPAFTGCESHVSQVSSCLLGPPDERRLCVVWGLGGTGKSQIALQAIENTKEHWADIVYVDAASRETTVSALNEFAVAKQIGNTHEDAIRWLGSNHHPWLLVFDNADDPDMNLPIFIPQGSHGRILITTRIRDLTLLGHGPNSKCNIGEMDPREALELLLKTARTEYHVLSVQDKESASELVKVSFSWLSVLYVIYLMVRAYT
jgi:hypothetical protein